MQIEVIQVGSLVTIADDIPARVTGIMIEDKGHVTYHCVWWNNGTRIHEWLEDLEVFSDDGSRSVTVGFRQ